MLISMERQAAALLVDLILSKGYSVSVNDGEEWTVKLSTNKEEITAALDTTGEDTLIIRDAAKNKVGTMFLVWGNSAPELVCDYTDNPETNDIWETWHNQVAA